MIRARAPGRVDPGSPLAGFIGRWWPLLLIGGLLGTGLGFAYGKLGPTLYQSTALLQVRPDPNSTRPAPDAQVTAIGFAAQALSPAALEHVSQALKDAGISLGSAELLSMSQSNKLTVQPVKGSSAILVTAIGEDPATAQALADKVASVVVQDAGDQARTASQNRRRELQDNLDRTRGDLANAQLYQRGQDLEQRLQQQRPLLLQLQSSYQQSLQQQVQLALSLRPPVPAGADAPTPTAAQQRQLSALSATAAGAVATELAMLKTQGAAAEASIADIDTQLVAVRDQLSALPAAQPTPNSSGTSAQATPTADLTGKISALQDQQTQVKDQQGQLQVLEKREHDLLAQRDDLRSQARTIQGQTQQATLDQQTADQQRQQKQQQLQQQIDSERNRYGLLKAQLDTFVPPRGATELTQTQLVQLQSVNSQIADSRTKSQELTGQLEQLNQTATSASTTEATVKLLQQQLQDVQQSTTGVDAQLQDVQTKRAALEKTLGTNPDGTLRTLATQILQLQQQQRDQDAAGKQTDAVRTRLQQQEQDLQRRKDEQRNQLLQIQRQQQQDIQRQADLGQRDVQEQVAQTAQQAAAAAASADPGTPPQLSESSELRDGLLGQIRDQQQQVSATMADLSRQLDEVHAAQAALPVKLDVAQATVQATVAAQTLSQLSQEYTRLLVNEASGVDPLERLGAAAPGTASGSQMRLVPVGAVVGLALAGALAYLLQTALYARRRLAPAPRLISGPTTSRDLGLMRHRAQ